MAPFARQGDRANLSYFTQSPCPSFCLALVHRSCAFGKGKQAWISESQVTGCRQEVCIEHTLAFPGSAPGPRVPLCAQPLAWEADSEL